MSHDVEKGSGDRVLTMPGVSVLTFLDGSRSAVVGLDEILAAVYDEGRTVSPRTAQEIEKRLAMRNRIDRSVRQWNHDLLLEEYRKYVETRGNASTTDSVANGIPAHGFGMAGALSRLLFRILPPTHPWPRM
jgi:hypothetical protein